MIAKRQIIVLSVLVVTVLAASHLTAERLAVHTSTVADGLAGDQITCITQDRRGLLWIGTRTGLSRFDGVSFRSFDTRDGLPHAGIFAILESADGTLWIGTGRGLSQMAEEPGDDGSAFKDAVGIPSGVVALAEDDRGILWATSRGTLYRCETPDDGIFVPFETGITWPAGKSRSIGTLLAAEDGGLWLGSSIGLHRLLPDGMILHYEITEDERPSRIHTLLRDSGGRIWVAGRRITVFKPEQPAEVKAAASKSRIRRLTLGAGPVLPSIPGQAIRLDHRDGLSTAAIFGLDEGPDGAIWIASHLGLNILTGTGITSHSRQTGLVSDHLGPILVDDAGNAWIGTQSHGLMRVNSTGFTSYTEEDGLIDRQTASITLGPSGEIVVISLPPEGAVNLHDGENFLPLPIPLPSDIPRIGWGLNQVTFFDHNGQLWVPTTRGLFRFPNLRNLQELPHTRHERRYLPDDEIYRLFEDSRGDIWLGVFGDTRLMRWDRSTDTLHHFGADDSIPYQAGTAFAEDQSGAVWIGFYGGGLARWRKNSFQLYGSDDGVPRGMVNCLLIDHRGRLWVGALADGLAVTDDPTADSPVWRFFTINDGLTSEGIFSLAEDRFGRIYAGSLKGVDRLEPDTGRIDHFDTSTGLVNNLVVDALTGPDGDLWFATDGGVSRYRPATEHHNDVPEVFIDRVTIDGTDHTVPLRGVTSMAKIQLPARTEVIDIGFTAVDLTPGSRLKFEVAVGLGATTWSPTHGDRFVRLAGLAPGSHTIRIRARLPNQGVGPTATLGLRIATPLWRRWWFLACAAATLAGAIWLFQRSRIQRLEELQRVRSRIAADLHDEMGLSLARVAILADVAGQKSEDSTATETLHEISSTARDLVDATSDMAWALDPRHDTLAALVARFRYMAAEVIEGSGARFVFDADTLEGVPMGSEARRHLLLILKEATRNACSHGRPNQLTIKIRRTPSRVVITLEDDGAGFDPEAPCDGQGLFSMKRRASSMGAVMAIDSAPGAGTRITLDIPINA
ncbi:MAG: hypothetical protein DRJ65_19870 [Acidobacteria bacterium]|nr:MAG: hypothetical protein DRJ65_19870 [Acidobacteriota bacterium]